MNVAPDRPSRWLGATVGAVVGLLLGGMAYVIAIDMPRSSSSTSWMLPGALGLGAVGGAIAGALAITEIAAAWRVPSRHRE